MGPDPIKSADILPNIKQNPVTKNSWNKYSSLEDLQPVYKPFMERTKAYVDEITLAGQQLVNEH